MTESRLIKSETFLLDEGNPLNIEIKAEIESLVGAISKEFPKCSVILGGSLCYGEGKTVQKGDKTEVASDVDIFLIFDSLLKCISARRNTSLSKLKSQGKAVKDIEFIIVWDKALKYHLTTLAGVVIRKYGNIEKLLNGMKLPEPVNNLKRSYKFLIKAISEGEQGMPFYEKSSIQAFQAFLFSKEKNTSYDEWKNFYSLKKCSERSENYCKDIGRKCADFIQNSVGSKLKGKSNKDYSVSEAKEIVESFLNYVRMQVHTGLRLNDYIRYVSYNLKSRKSINLAVNSTSLYFETTDEILKDYNSGNGEMKRASRLLLKLTGESIPEKMPLMEKMKLSADILMEYDSSYFHKASD